MPLWGRRSLTPLHPTAHPAVRSNDDTPLPVMKKKIKTATSLETFDPWSKADGLLRDIHEGKQDDDHRLDRTSRWRGNDTDFDERTREPVAGSGCVSIRIDFGFQWLLLPTVEVPHHVIFSSSGMSIRPDWREQVNCFLAYKAIPTEMPDTTNIQRIYDIIKTLPLTAESYEDSEQSWIDSRGTDSLSKCIGQYLSDLQRHWSNFNFNNAKDVDFVLSRHPLTLSFDTVHRLFSHPEFWENFDQLDTKPFPVDLEAARKRDLVYFVDAMSKRRQELSFQAFACEVIAQCHPSDIKRYTFHSHANRLVNVVHRAIENHGNDTPLLRNACRALCSLGKTVECLQVMVKHDVLRIIVAIVEGDKQKDETLELSVLRFVAGAARTKLENSDNNDALRSWLTTMKTFELVIKPMHVLGTKVIFEAGLDALCSLSLLVSGWNAEAARHVMTVTLIAMKQNQEHLFIQTHGCRLISFILSNDSYGEATQMLVRSSPGGVSAILSPMLGWFQADEYLQSHVCKVLHALPSETLLRVMRDYPDALMVQEAGFSAMVAAEASALNKGLLFGVSSIRMVLAAMERHASCKRLQFGGCKVIMHLATWDFCENGPLAIEMVSAIMSTADAHGDQEGIVLATIAALRARGTEHINALFLDFIATAIKTYREEQPTGAPAFEVFLDLTDMAGETKLSAPITALSTMKKFCRNEAVQFSGCKLLDAMTVSGEGLSDSAVKDLVEAQAEVALSAVSTAFPHNAPLVAHAGAVVVRLKDYAAL